MKRDTNKRNYIICCILSVILISLLVSSCGKSQETIQDRKTAERFAISYFANINYIYFSVEKTIYDKDTKKYIVYVKSIDDTLFKKGIVEIKDGKVIRCSEQDWDPSE